MTVFSVVIYGKYAILIVYSYDAFDPSARDGEISGGRYFLILRATSILLPIRICV